MGDDERRGCRGPEHPDARFGARSVLALAAVALVAVPFGLLLFFVQSRWPPLQHVDDVARDRLHRFALDHDVFTAVMKAASTAGSSPVYFVVFTLVAGWLLYRRQPRPAVFVVVTEVGGAVVNGAVKTVVHRARPVVADPVAHASGLSFPSGHAQSAVVSYSLLLLLCWQALPPLWRWVATATATVAVLAIGLSRIALSVHYVSDVLAGYALGAAWITVMTAVLGAWRRERGSPPDRVPARAA
ncbi:phosphatase PAP2 family protein [Actinosynnema sp. NPDC047251]|uniref:Putative membrane protein n=1 Tax=Saccharothrix espanaensis (strain ATCC 51144 / DSM 44229 / JCM 9112 / NBRC 15066 / NRRL 15764) TaxID=1179773 RepID=K0K2W5_SACES|nr:phosphatase PAP2 family protein [Saccharothrix espanaensis]CCH32621.1 putative membrane protein [Saccharothrix espanaensis DSM 44229]